jgi:hypothetical protein
VAERQPTHADLAAQLAEGGRRFAMIEKRLTEIADKLEPLPQMQADIAATKDIVEAWSAFKTFGKFIKWLSGLVVACGALWAAIKFMAMGAIR